MRAEGMDEEFELMNRVNYYRHRLDDIRVWYGQLPETMLAVSSARMDLAPARGSGRRLPGGDAMVMIGPWSSDADEGDDTPHPAQIVREWVERLAGEAAGSWTANWRWLVDAVPMILGSQWASAWCSDIDALWHRLASLTGNAPVVESDEVQRRLVDHADDLPDDAMLTLAQVEAAWPGRGISGRIRSARSKENARARREDRPPRHRLEPDRRGRYRLGDLRALYPDTLTRSESLRSTAGSVT